MARSLQGVLGVLDKGAHAGGLEEQEVEFLAQVLEDLPALAWDTSLDAASFAPLAPRKEDDEEPSGQPLTAALVVGGAALAEALTERADGRVFECERTEDSQMALDLARAHAPDLVLIDADFPRAAELTEALLDDPLTEPVPIVVVGSFRASDDAARFIALGVAKSLARPTSDALIRRACDEVLDAKQEHATSVMLGEPTIEQLADRLSAQLRGALVDGLDPLALATRVPLVEGTEVLGALWGAIARVQEVIVRKTGGAIRFGGSAPEGAIALAPWLHQDVAAADRLAEGGRGVSADVRLRGRRVVVADDDPGVTWFISDLLRTAGCEVHEALDGIAARDLAFRIQPELVVSDILMPGLDGFALCRSLKRDVALRDTPVILLSWKEDLLQRVRELGASAAAYMRKESDSRAVLARVREVLRPRARIEARLKADGEVRGRLDGLSPRLLLHLVCAIRKDARVVVRDATCLYEIDVRSGAPRRAARTLSDGVREAGPSVLGHLLGVGAGRFVVLSEAGSIEEEMSGTLRDLLARPIAVARGAQVATTGARMMEVASI
ncbi:MAG: response regulator, partial [Polyangiaceae bacterium]